MLGNVDKDFLYIDNSATDLSASLSLFTGLPYGWVAWRKRVFPFVSVILCNRARLLGIKVTMSAGSMLTFSVHADNVSHHNKNLAEITVSG